MKAKEEFVELNASKNFSCLVPNSSDMDEVMKEVAFVLTKIKKNLMINLATEID